MVRAIMDTAPHASCSAACPAAASPASLRASDPCLLPRHWDRHPQLHQIRSKERKYICTYGTFSFVTLSRSRPFPPLPNSPFWSPSVVLASPSLGLGSPSLGSRSPSLGLGSPSLGLGSPSLGLGSPSLDLGGQSLGLGPRAGNYRVGEKGGPSHVSLQAYK